MSRASIRRNAKRARLARTYKRRSKGVIVDGARVTWHQNELGVGRIFVVPLELPQRSN